MPEKPQKIGKYVIQDILGKGGMGIVYKAYDPVLDRQVAIKMMVSVGVDEELKERFYREAQSLGTLRHRNVITIYDLGQEGMHPYIAMEFLTGTDLDKIIKARQQIEITRKLDIMSQVCDGLDCAHQAGIIHRDVKPANIRVLDDGLVKIMDFGIARMSSSATMTRSGLIMGTVHYMSPEQVKGVKVDGRSDIFAVGAVLFEFLTYKKPFHADTMTSVLYKIVNESPPALSSLGIEAPPDLERILNQALSKDVSTRYQSIATMSSDLLALISKMRHDEQIEAEKRRITEIMERGEQHMREAQFQEAQEAFDRVLTIAPEHNEATRLAETAEREWRKAWTGQLIMEGRELLNGEFYEDALLRFQEVLSIDPDHVEASQLAHRAQQREDNERREAENMIVTKRKQRLELEKATNYVDFDHSTSPSSVTTRRLRIPRTTLPQPLPPPPSPPPPPMPSPMEETQLAAIKPSSPTPRLIQRLGGIRAMTMCILAIVLLFTALVYVFHSTPKRQTGDRAPGSVVFNILPWAQVDRIIDVSSNLPVVGLEMPLTTPCTIQLPEGKYLIQTSNPVLRKSKDFEIVVKADLSVQLNGSFDGYDQEKVLNILTQ